jgi:hypothetical protein
MGAPKIDIMPSPKTCFTVPTKTMDGLHHQMNAGIDELLGRFWVKIPD